MGVLFCILLHFIYGVKTHKQNKKEKYMKFSPLAAWIGLVWTGTGNKFLINLQFILWGTKIHFVMIILISFVLFIWGCTVTRLWAG
jgi:hypothetical protein